MASLYVQLSCPPWKLMFTCPAVYALLLQALLDGAGFYIIYTTYPTYMKTVLNYDITQVLRHLLCQRITTENPLVKQKVKVKVLVVLAVVMA